jgi:WD40 repeat protein
MLTGHKNAVLEVQWTYDSSQIISASADKTVGVWDAQVSLDVYVVSTYKLTEPYNIYRRANV